MCGASARFQFLLTYGYSKCPSHTLTPPVAVEAFVTDVMNVKLAGCFRRRFGTTLRVSLPKIVQIFFARAFGARNV